MCFGIHDCAFSTHKVLKCGFNMLTVLFDGKIIWTNMCRKKIVFPCSIDPSLRIQTVIQWSQWDILHCEGSDCNFSTGSGQQTKMHWSNFSFNVSFYSILLCAQFLSCERYHGEHITMRPAFWCWIDQQHTICLVTATQRFKTTDFLLPANHLYLSETCGLYRQTSSIPPYKICLFCDTYFFSIHP